MYISYYRCHFTSERRHLELAKYKESKVIIEEYKTFICSLSDDDKKFLDESLKQGFFSETSLRLHPDIIENWESIVINPNKHSLEDINLKELGKRLKEARINKGFTRANASRYLEIAERTLRSYEDGDREIGVKSLYKMMQLYQVGDISDFFINS